MDLFVVLGLFVSVGAASIGLGQDSRPGLDSKEEELASYGVSWQDRD